MEEKLLFTRIQHKHDTSENWAKAAATETSAGFIPKEGELIIYDDLNKIKIGNGMDNVNDLPFAEGSIGQALNGGEIFNDYENNAIESYDDIDNTYAHAEGCYTTAGWRSHAEGYRTLANNTSHAEGRLTQATGQGAHAEGVDISTDLTYDDGTEVTVLNSFSIDINQFTVIGDCTTLLQIGDIISIRPQPYWESS